MRFAYADPPYPGKSRKYYGDHPDFAGEVDHVELLDRLCSPGRFDGWALSTSADALPYVLSLCAGETRRVRVAAWVKGGRTNRAARAPLSSWEPVVYAGAREGTTRFDSLVHAARPRLTDPNRVVGAKPATFCRWLFELLGATAGDELVDMFPGSGGVLRAWEIYASSPTSDSIDPSPVPAVQLDMSGSAADDASCVATVRHDDPSCEYFGTDQLAEGAG